MSLKKRTQKRKFERTSLLTRPDQEGLRIFDTPGVKITGQVVGEDNQSVMLAWPAAVAINVNAADGKLTYRVRFEPIAFAGERYQLYRSAIRGESYRYEPALLQGYAAFAEKAAAGGFDLRAPLPQDVPTLTFEPSDTPAPEVGADTGGGDGAHC